MNHIPNRWRNLPKDFSIGNHRWHAGPRRRRLRNVVIYPSLLPACTLDDESTTSILTTALRSILCRVGMKMNAVTGPTGISPPLRGHVHVTSAKFLGFLTPFPPCLHFGPIHSTKFTQPPLLHMLLGYPPLPLPMQTSYVQR